MSAKRRYIVKGDANGDGKVTYDDYLLIQRHILGDVELTGDAFTAADINDDGVISIVDAVLVHRHLTGMEMITDVVEVIENEV